MRSGDIIDQRFEPESEIAAGGMGRVFRAIDRHQGQRVAAKMLEVQTESLGYKKEAEAVLDWTPCEKLSSQHPSQR